MTGRPGEADADGFYPPCEAAEHWLLPVGDDHAVYVEHGGAPRGLPAVFLHGGPGSGAKPDHRRYFCPRRYRFVIFDQRGSGRSVPHGCIRANTLEHLCADMERIRRHLNIDRWLLFGGSWGATLALAYARRHPGRVLGMILRGVFLAREADLQWHNRSDGVARVFPDGWERFLSVLPAEARADPLTCVAHLVLRGTPEEQRSAAAAWSEWSGQTVTYALPPAPAEEEEEDERIRLERVRIEMHYAENRYFLRDDEILREAASLPRVPVRILHGRRDMTCLPYASWELHRAMPDSTLSIVHEAGHLASEPPMRRALIEALNDFADNAGSLSRAPAAE